LHGMAMLRGDSQRKLVMSARGGMLPGNMSARSSQAGRKRIDDEDHEMGAEEIESLLDEEQEAIAHEPESLDETTYGFAITSLVRDSVAMVARDTEAKWIRAGRLATSLFLILMTSGLQLYVMYQVARLLCGKAVVDMRATYAQYETQMYPGNTEKTARGFIRGIHGRMEADRFTELDESLQEAICNIPLAHPFFLSTILLIWTLTCLRDVRRLVNQSTKLLIVTPSVHSLCQLKKQDENKVEIDGLTYHLKAVICLIMSVRLFTVLGLLWLGCRWLTATIGLDEMFLNGLALEFVLVLQELLYAVLVPHRHQIATTSTLILPMSYPGKESVHCLSFFGAFMWAGVAIGFVLLYIFVLQQVLPDFRWDVRDVCDEQLPKFKLA